MEQFCSDKASRARKYFLALKTRKQPRVPFHEQCRTYVGYEQMANEELLRAYEEAMVVKNAVLAAAKALRAEKENERAMSSRIPSPSNAHVRDRRQVPPERSGSRSERGPLQDGPEEKPEVERELSQKVQQQRQQQEQPMPPAPPRTWPVPPLLSSPQRQDELQTASAPKEETLHDGDPSREEQTLIATAKTLKLAGPMVLPKKDETEEMGDDQELVLMEKGCREEQEGLVPLAQTTRTLPLPPLWTAEPKWWLDLVSSDTPPPSPPSPQKQVKMSGDQQETAGKEVVVVVVKETGFEPEDSEVMEKPAQ